MELSTLLYAFLLATSLLYLIFLRRRHTGPPLPPGPTGLPLVGSLPFLDPSLHTYFANLSHEYGPIFSLRLGSKLAVVISSPELARAVLKDQDITFANRDIPATARVISYGGGQDIVWNPNGPVWRMLRRCAREVLSPAGLEAVSTLRHREFRSAIRHIHARSGKPVDVGAEMFLTVMNVITNTLWGGMLEGDEERQSIGKEFRELVAKITELLGLPNVSDFFPALEPFDLQGMQRKMEGLKDRFDAIFTKIIERRRRRNEGENEKDFLEFMLKMEAEGGDSKTPFTMTHVKALLMDMVVGGTETTSNTMEWTLAEMMNKPEILKKAQDEIDRVVGKDKMVQESHIPQLHYLSLVIKEVLRLHPALPLLVPHCPSSSGTVGGFLVPEGCRVFLNVWAIQRDPSVWKDPLEFRPERFLEGDYKSDYTNEEFNYLPFGSGRRICAGIAMAERMMGYLLATLLHSFDWELPAGTRLDLTEKFGIVMKKATPLVAIPKPRLLNAQLYF